MSLGLAMKTMRSTQTNKAMKAISVIAGVCLLFLSCPGFSQDSENLKIGYTNVDYILGLLPEAKQISSELQSYQKQLEDQLQSKYQEFQTKLNDYQQKASSGQMIPEVMKDKENELANLRESIQKFQKDADESIQKKQSDLLQPAYDKIQKAINSVAKENGYTHVFTSDAGTYPVLLYVRDQDNLTDLILKKLGVQPPAKQDSLSQQK
jgi:outer membrane protein